MPFLMGIFVHGGDSSLRFSLSYPPTPIIAHRPGSFPVFITFSSFTSNLYHEGMSEYVMAGKRSDRRGAV